MPTGHRPSDEPIPYRLAAETFGDAEIAAGRRVIESGRLTLGERVRGFEREFAAWVGAKHAVMVNSGSSANLLVADALVRRGVEEPPLAPGDEVLVPALAWPTTVWPLVQVGLVPVFVDVDPVTLAIDVESAASALGPRTRGAFLIHVLGRAVDMTQFGRFCRDRGLVLIEDGCESLGAHWEGRHVGMFGMAGTFSFYFSHHISTIEGGMIVTDDDALADDLLSLRAHGWVRDRSDRSWWAEQNPAIDDRFLFATLGYNVRPTEIQAAIGSVQLGRLDEMIAARDELARKVSGWLRRYVPWLELIGEDCLGASSRAARAARRHSWMTLPMRLRDGAPVDRGTVVRKLESLGVETRPIIAGNLARHPAARRFVHRTADSLATCDRLLSRGFMTGCHPVPVPGSVATLERAILSLARL